MRKVSTWPGWNGPDLDPGKTTDKKNPVTWTRTCGVLHRDGAFGGMWMLCGKKVTQEEMHMYRGACPACGGKLE